MHRSDFRNAHFVSILRFPLKIFYFDTGNYYFSRSFYPPVRKHRTIISVWSLECTFLLIIRNKFSKLTSWLWLTLYIVFIIFWFWFDVNLSFLCSLLKQCVLCICLYLQFYLFCNLLCFSLSNASEYVWPRWRSTNLFY